MMDGRANDGQGHVLLVKVIVGPDSELFLGGRELYILDLNFLGGRGFRIWMYMLTPSLPTKIISPAFSKISLYTCV